MDKDLHNPISCSQFEALLADALDGILSEEMSQAFEEHTQSCLVCGPMFAETRQGMLLLQALPELGPPRNLVHNVLVATTGAEATKNEVRPAVKQPGLLSRLWSRVVPRGTGVMQPRFVTSFAMAFFSLSLTFSLAGIRVKDLPKSPSAVKRVVVLQYTQIENRVVRYYENMRLVYEIESRVRELRKATAPAEDEGKPQEQPKKKDKNNNSDTSDHEQNRHEHYSQELDNGMIAYLKTSNEGA